MAKSPYQERKMYFVTKFLKSGSQYCTSIILLISSSSECQSVLRMCRCNDLSYLADVVTLVCPRGVCPPPFPHSHPITKQPIISVLSSPDRRLPLFIMMIANLSQSIIVLPPTNVSHSKKD